MSTYDQLTAHLVETALLGSCGSLLGWDEQTMLPQGGAEHRANQTALISGLVHERRTDARMADWLSELESSDLDDEQVAVVREARRSYDRATKLPKALVEEMSRTATLGQHAWIEARKEKRFDLFEEWLSKTIALKREEAQAVGGGDVPYDALLDDYETGAKTADVQAVFTPLREELVKLVGEINNSSVKPDTSILTRSFCVDKQREFGLAAAESIGFDFSRGRLDIAAHPFCSDIGPGDCRLTTRYDEKFFPMALFGTLHEAGHGIYEQGLRHDAFGLATGHAASLGIHESQSRMWENFVGRSRAFWKHFWPKIVAAFPEPLAGVEEGDFYRAINNVSPSFIRVEADEVTYNLHIMLRFELEQSLISGDLGPADVPAAWDEKFAAYFGITPPDVAQGCLQDIHWSAGLLGYFPTYALGNMYAAQIFNAAEKELGDLNEMFSRGEFSPLKEWLNRNIHQRGTLHRAPQLVEVVTGESLSHQPLVAHLRAKFGEVYELN